jgi:hypothetical protein
MRILQDWNVRYFSWIRQDCSGYIKIGSLLSGRVIVTFEKHHNHVESVVMNAYRCKPAFGIMSACKLQSWNRNSAFIMITELFVVAHWSNMKVYVPCGDEEECSYDQAMQDFITFYYVVWINFFILTLPLSLFPSPLAHFCPRLYALPLVCYEWPVLWAKNDGQVLTEQKAIFLPLAVNLLYERWLTKTVVL